MPLRLSGTGTVTGTGTETEESLRENSTDYDGSYTQKVPVFTAHSR
jgi:hypothetical protein